MHHSGLPAAINLPTTPADRILTEKLPISALKCEYHGVKSSTSPLFSAGLRTTYYPLRITAQLPATNLLMKALPRFFQIIQSRGTKRNGKMFLTTCAGFEPTRPKP
ncbi:uncharacterized protein EAF02_010895 [Botrytis sinoallii]|uniref:uncharacterized protein n=1 Tax=Botrytis sinoallii TaxID=1463999 RepID=UPI001900EE8A|nr:uncharacterized protein EAF02_010895 [Botrytis sinoallii]KAF7859447.1 hypothetical protein EAF02_010895 [Botrytis sinoallii]